jgi:hypothetical protein
LWERYEEYRNLNILTDEKEGRVEKYYIFLFGDLFPFLKSTNTLTHNDDSIDIPKGSLAIPFHFSIPHNALESYQGKDARISYEVEFSIN